MGYKMLSLHLQSSPYLVLLRHSELISRQKGWPYSTLCLD